jgi:Ca2+-binding RTX toxin-like protein
MSIISRRARRALLAAAVPAALAATALPASADAATARVVPIGPTAVPQLQYIAAPGEANDVRVAFTGLHIHIDDTAPITAGNGCVIDDDGDAICVPGEFQDQYSLGDGRDTIRYLAPHAARVDMGAGDDTYFGALRRDSIGSNGLVVQPADVIGGSGADLLTYRSSQRGVTVTLDGQFNDGDRGEENARPDWEHIEGSGFNDTLTGSNDPNKLEQYTGFAGNDTLTGLDGTDVFNEGSAPSGADTIAGGAGIDRVNYGQRTTGVTVNLSDVVRNDGAPGEADFVDPNTNDVVGGSAVDNLIGGAGANVFNGGGSDDTLRGNGGEDRLIGGSGADSLFGGEQNDVLDTADTVADRIMDCEGGSSDVLNRDLRDVNASGCEIVNSVGVLKLAPSAISAEAGKAAKLRLSWSHPKSWKQLRSVELRIEDAGKVVIRPAAERIEDSGDVKVLRRSRLTHKGKKVSAQLAIRLDKRLAGETLSIDVEATDVKGRRQLQRDAGTIAVG